MVCRCLRDWRRERRCERESAFEVGETNGIAGKLRRPAFTRESHASKKPTKPRNQQHEETTFATLTCKFQAPSFLVFCMLAFEIGYRVHLLLHRLSLISRAGLTEVDRPSQPHSDLNVQMFDEAFQTKYRQIGIQSDLLRTRASRYHVAHLNALFQDPDMTAEIGMHCLRTQHIDRSPQDHEIACFGRDCEKSR